MTEIKNERSQKQADNLEKGKNIDIDFEDLISKLRYPNNVI